VQVDRAAIDARFDSVDSQIDFLKDEYCTNTQSDQSAICNEIDYIKSTLDTVRTEQTTYYTNLDTTTTNTWDLLSGDVTTNINLALENLGIIRGQTTQINETVEGIRTTQLEEIQIAVIS